MTEMSKINPDYTTAQMKLWREIVIRIWATMVLPNALVALACGFGMGLLTARLFGWEPMQ